MPVVGTAILTINSQNSRCTKAKTLTRNQEACMYKMIMVPTTDPDSTRGNRLALRSENEVRRKCDGARSRQRVILRGGAAVEGTASRPKSCLANATRL